MATLPIQDECRRGRIGVLLKNKIVAADTHYLVPAHAGYPWKAFDGLRGSEILKEEEVAVGQAVGWALAIREDVEKLVGISDPRLRQAVSRCRSAREDGFKRGYRE